MAAVIVARRRHRNARRERIFRRRVSLFDLSENEIIRRYRLPGRMILSLLDDIKHEIEPITQRSHALPGIVKLLSTLQVLGSGSIQNPIAGASGLSQSSLSRTMWEVVPAIVRRVSSHIKFPQNRHDIEVTKQAFIRIAGFPNVVGAMDCTHVLVVPPLDTVNLFRNRKHTHSINIQVVCDANNIITHVNAKFPGSVHDDYIFRNSSVHKMVQDMDDNSWLLGDRDYQLQPWLMTPVCSPANDGETAYNRAHIRTWGVVERTFGMLKSRFRCLDHSGGSRLYTPSKVCQIVVVCCILHNIALRAGLRVEEHEDNSDTGDEEEELSAPVVDMQEDKGSFVRQHIIQKYFQ